MSIDILILRISEPAQSLDELTSGPQPLGSRADVINELARVTPGAESSGKDHVVFVDGEKLAIELDLLADEPVESLSLTVRIGRDFEEDHLLQFLDALCRPNGWSAFELGTNDRIAPRE